MIKTLELFGGIGSPRKALENLIGSENIKKIDYVEWWDWPVHAYNLLFNNNERTQDVKNWNLNVDILVHGSPCQDFSTAGKNDLATGRSILYRRTLEIIKKELYPKPKFVIWENVKGLLNKRNFPHFQHYLDAMAEYGYKNYYKILNSKDFGIPQSRNRVFCVSVRNDLDFKFDFENLETSEMKPLKNFLQPASEIDKSYYITQKSMAKAIETGKIKIVDNFVGTVTTKQMRWNNQGVVKMPLHDKQFNSTDKVHNIEGMMSTIGSNSANNRIAQLLKIKGFDKNGIAKIQLQHKPFYQTDKVHNINSKMGTIGINPQNNRLAIPIVEVNKNYDYRMSDGSKRPIGEINKEGNITIPITNNHTSNKIGVNISPTLTTNPHKVAIEAIEPIPDVPIFIIDGKPYHLRVLTQRETWRLMGWQDDDIDKVINMPKTKLYHMAGNAIVIQVLEAIFKPIVKFLEGEKK